MSLPTPTPSTIAAVDYNLEQIWDAVRALRIAFRLDPALPPEPGDAKHLPPEQVRDWRQLTTGEQLAFKLAASGALSTLSCAQAHFSAKQGD